MRQGPAAPAPTRVLRDRDGELGALRDALAGARSGSGAVLLVEGPAGIGKTRLLGAAIEMASESRMRTLSARGNWTEREFSFGVVLSLLTDAVTGEPAGSELDTLEGEAGRDVLYGDDDRDELHGGDDRDTLNGDDDKDKLYGDAGDDTLRGGNGADYMNGGTGRNYMRGGSGNDRLDGGAGSTRNRLYGESGSSDRCRRRSFNDYLSSCERAF